MRQIVSSLLVSAVLVGSAACSGSIRVYDEPHRDYHRWNGGENRYYRVWLGERHMEYREFNRLERRDQDEYWQWRHSHR